MSCLSSKGQETSFPQLKMNMKMKVNVFFNWPYPVIQMYINYATFIWESPIWLHQLIHIKLWTCICAWERLLVHLCKSCYCVWEMPDPQSKIDYRVFFPLFCPFFVFSLMLFSACDITESLSPVKANNTKCYIPIILYIFQTTMYDLKYSANKLQLVWLKR